MPEVTPQYEQPVSSQATSFDDGCLTIVVLGAVLIAIGLVEILTARPREVHVATIVLGVPLPILGALGLIRATRRMRAWVRWPIVYVATLVLMFAGLLLGATMVPRYLGS